MVAPKILQFSKLGVRKHFYQLCSEMRFQQTTYYSNQWLSHSIQAK